MHRGVQWLHCGVGEMRRFVDCLDDLSALRESIVDIAVIARGHHRAVERVAIKLGKLRAVGFAGFARIPFRLKQRKRFLGAPKAIGDDRNRIVELDHLLHATPTFDRRFVDTLELAAEHRTGSNGRIDHVRKLSIDREFGGAVDLQRRVQAGDRLADEFELIRRPDCRLLVELDLGGIRGERAIVEAASGRLVQ